MDIQAAYDNLKQSGILQRHPELLPTVKQLIQQGRIKDDSILPTPIGVNMTPGYGDRIGQPVAQPVTHVPVNAYTPQARVDSPINIPARPVATAKVGQPVNSNITDDDKQAYLDKYITPKYGSNIPKHTLNVLLTTPREEWQKTLQGFSPVGHAALVNEAERQLALKSQHSQEDKQQAIRIARYQAQMANGGPVDSDLTDGTGKPIDPSSLSEDYLNSIPQSIRTGRSIEESSPSTLIPPFLGTNLDARMRDVAQSEPSFGQRVESGAESMTTPVGAAQLATGAALGPGLLGVKLAKALPYAFGAMQVPQAVEDVKQGNYGAAAGDLAIPAAAIGLHGAYELNNARKLGILLGSDIPGGIDEPMSNEQLMAQQEHLANQEASTKAEAKRQAARAKLTKSAQGSASYGRYGVPVAPVNTSVQGPQNVPGTTVPSSQGYRQFTANPNGEVFPSTEYNVEDALSEGFTHPWFNESLLPPTLDVSGLADDVNSEAKTGGIDYGNEGGESPNDVKNPLDTFNRRLGKIGVGSYAAPNLPTPEPTVSSEVPADRPLATLANAERGITPATQSLLPPTLDVSGLTDDTDTNEEGGSAATLTAPVVPPVEPTSTIAPVTEPIETPAPIGVEESAATTPEHEQVSTLAEEPTATTPIPEHGTSSVNDYNMISSKGEGGSYTISLTGDNYDPNSPHQEGLLGSVSAVPDADTPGVWRINDSRVAPELRGKGYGTILYNRIITDLFNNLGANRVTSDTRVSNAAGRVWKSLGNKWNVISRANGEDTQGGGGPFSHYGEGPGYSIDNKSSAVEQPAPTQKPPVEYPDTGATRKGQRVIVKGHEALGPLEVIQGGNNVKVGFDDGTTQTFPASEVVGIDTPHIGKIDPASEHGYALYRTLRDAEGQGGTRLPDPADKYLADNFEKWDVRYNKDKGVDTSDWENDPLEYDAFADGKVPDLLKDRQEPVQSNVPEKAAAPQVPETQQSSPVQATQPAELPDPSSMNDRDISTELRKVRSTLEMSGLPRIAAGKGVTPQEAPKLDIPGVQDKVDRLTALREEISNRANAATKDAIDYGKSIGGQLNDIGHASAAAIKFIGLAAKAAALHIANGVLTGIDGIRTWLGNTFGAGFTRFTGDVWDKVKNYGSTTKPVDPLDGYNFLPPNASATDRLAKMKENVANGSNLFGTLTQTSQDKINSERIKNGWPMLASHDPVSPAKGSTPIGANPDSVIAGIMRTVNRANEGRYAASGYYNRDLENAQHKLVSTDVQANAQADRWTDVVRGPDKLTDDELGKIVDYAQSERAKDINSQGSEAAANNTLKVLSPAEEKAILSDPRLKGGIDRYNSIVYPEMTALRKTISPNLVDRAKNIGMFMSLHANRVDPNGIGDVSDTDANGNSVPGLSTLIDDTRRKQQYGSSKAKQATGSAANGYIHDMRTNFYEGSGADIYKSNQNAVYRALLNAKDSQGNPLAIEMKTGKAGQYSGQKPPTSIKWEGRTLPAAEFNFTMTDDNGKPVTKRIYAPPDVVADLHDSVNPVPGQGTIADDLNPLTRLGVQTALLSPTEPVNMAGRHTGNLGAQIAQYGTPMERLIAHALPPIGAGIPGTNIKAYTPSGLNLVSWMRMKGIENHPDFHSTVQRLADANAFSVRPYQSVKGTGLAKLPLIGKPIEAYQDATHSGLFGMPGEFADTELKQNPVKWVVSKAGMDGVHVRALVVSEMLRHEVEGNDDPAAIRRNAYQFGQYVNKPDNMIEIGRKWAPFTATTVPTKVAEAKQTFTGQTGIKRPNATPGQKVGDSASTLWTKVGLPLAGTMIANYVYSHHPIWQNQPGHKTDIEIPDGKSGFSYLNPNYGSPTSVRPGRDSGILPAYEAAADGGDSNDIGAAAASGVLNGVASTAVPPWLQFGLTAGAGIEPYFKPENGQVVLQHTPKVEPDESQFMNNVGAAVLGSNNMAQRGAQAIRDRYGVRVWGTHPTRQ